MRDKPRDRKAFILNRNMYENILGVGGFFFLLLFVLLFVFEHADIRQLTDLFARALRQGRRTDAL